jgi:hypothetical protein
MSTVIPMTKENRLNILKRAREILSSPSRFATGRLRKEFGGFERFCVLGACERAVYDLDLAKEGPTSFRRTEVKREEPPVDAYQLGRDLSLHEFAVRNYSTTPDGVNDTFGYERTIEMLDSYIVEVEGTP